MYCPKCGYEALYGTKTCLQCGASIEEGQIDISDVPGLVKRLLALFIDIAVAAIPVVVLGMLLGTKGAGIGLLAAFFYFSVIEASGLSATLGKLAMHISVVDLKGKRVKLSFSLFRNLMKLLTLAGIVSIPVALFSQFRWVAVIGVFGLAGLPSFIFLDTKQALHDLAARTIVIVKRNKE